MKKLLIVLLCSLFFPAGVFASEWGLLESASEETGEGGRKRWITKGLINKIAPAGNAAPEAITFCVDGDLSGNNGEKFALLVSAAFSEWLSGTEKYINESGRAGEFADILPLLRRGPNLKRVNCSCADESISSMVAKGSGAAGYPCAKPGMEPDIHFVFGPAGSAAAMRASGNKGVIGVHIRREDKRLIVVDYDSSRLSDTLIHEIGHALGLGDQYFSALYNSRPETGVYDEEPSVMNDAYNVTCDDAEGIINLIDCFRAPPAKPFYRGGKKGWESICPGRNVVYASCLAKGRPEMRVISSLNDGEYRVHEYSKGGRLKNTKKYNEAVTVTLYNIYGKRSYEKIKRDSKNRIVYTKDTEGYEMEIAHKDYGVRYTLFKNAGSVHSFSGAPHKKDFLAVTDVSPSDDGGVDIRSTDMRGRTYFFKASLMSPGDILVQKSAYSDNRDAVLEKEMLVIFNDGEKGYKKFDAFFEPEDGGPKLELAYMSLGQNTAYSSACCKQGRYAVCKRYEHDLDFNITKEEFIYPNKFLIGRAEDYGVYDLPESVQLALKDSGNETAEFIKSYMAGGGNLRYIFKESDIVKELELITESGVLKQASSADKVKQIQNIKLPRATKEEVNTGREAQKREAEMVKELRKINKENLKNNTPEFN